jgi:hypothetical protein
MLIALGYADRAEHGGYLTSCRVRRGPRRQASIWYQLSTSRGIMTVIVSVPPGGAHQPPPGPDAGGRRWHPAARRRPHLVDCGHAC